MTQPIECHFAGLVFSFYRSTTFCTASTRSSSREKILIFLLYEGYTLIGAEPSPKPGASTSLGAIAQIRGKNEVVDFNQFLKILLWPKELFQQWIHLS